MLLCVIFFFFQAEDGIRDYKVTGVQTCALPIWLALLNDPERAEMLRAEPELMPQAIEELLRHSGPSRAQFRRAAEDMALGGAAIAKGDRVALMLAAANRDPEQFPDP